MSWAWLGSNLAYEWEHRVSDTRARAPPHQLVTCTAPRCSTRRPRFMMDSFCKRGCEEMLCSRQLPLSHLALEGEENIAERRLV